MYYIALVIFFMVQSTRRKAGRIVFLCHSLFLIIFAFLTREGSWDYFGYYEYYKCATSNFCNSVGFEPSYGYISQFASFVANEWGFELTYLFYIAVSIWIKMSLMSRFSKMLGFAVFSFICYGYFIHDLTQIRASLSLAILWISYFYWIEKKFLRAALIFTGAVFFHISAILGVVVVISRVFSTKLLLILSVASVLLGSFAAKAVQNLPQVGFDRLQVYLDALGSELLTAPQFSFYVVTIFIVACIAFKNGVAETSGIERYGLNAMFLGVIIYMCIYFIPIIPLRILEIFSSLYPFVSAEAYRKSRSTTEKLFLVVVFFGLFLNTAVRNNIRIDLVFPWQIINAENLSELQLEHFIRSKSDF